LHDKEERRANCFSLGEMGHDTMEQADERKERMLFISGREGGGCEAACRCADKRERGGGLGAKRGERETVFSAGNGQDQLLGGD